MDEDKAPFGQRPGEAVDMSGPPPYAFTGNVEATQGPMIPADQRLRAELHKEYEAAAKSAEAFRAALEVAERVMAACVAALEHFEDQAEAPTPFDPRDPRTRY